MENNNCMVNLPYPDIEGVKPNLHLAQFIKDAYMGRDGELSGISDYIYQSIVLEESVPMFTQLLECMAITEMEHFKILGKLILLLGENPYIRSQIRTNIIKPNTDISENLAALITNNIKKEEKSIQMYEKIISLSGDTVLNAILQRIIIDEEHHIKLFNDMLVKIQ